MINSWLLFGHLIGVAGIIAGVGLEEYALAASQRAKTVAELRAASGPGRFLPVMMPLAVVLLTACGLGLVARTDEFSFGDAWVVAAVGIVVGMSVLGGVVNGERAKRLASAAESAPDGPVTAELSALAHDRVLVTGVRIGAVATIEAIWLMTIKPSAPGTLVSLGVMLVLIVGAAMSVRMGVAVRSADVETQTAAPHTMDESVS
jgi:hypothetical protein